MKHIANRLSMGVLRGAIVAALICLAAIVANAQTRVSKEQAIYKGTQYTIQTGAKGGQYIMTPDSVKHYLQRTEAYVTKYANYLIKEKGMEATAAYDKALADYGYTNGAKPK